MSDAPSPAPDQRPGVATVLWGEGRSLDRGPGAAIVRLAPLLAFALIPLLLVAMYVDAAITAHSLGLDFRQSFWPAGRAVLHGHSPYPPLDLSVLRRGSAYVYPPVVAIAIAPLALLPVGVATAIAVAVTVAALAGTLWTLGVREWRCYCVSFASPAVLGAIQTAALSALLAFGIALAWRWRGHRYAAPVLVAAMIAAKLFLFPLLLWLLIVRGARSAILTGFGALAIIVLPWLCGFPGLREYPALLSMLTQVDGGHAYSPRALALSLGASTGVAQGLAILLGGLLLSAVILTVRRPGAEVRTLALVTVAALFLSPVVWSHYLVLLLPVLAIARPHMGWQWLALPALWLTGGNWDAAHTRQIVMGLLVMILASAPAILERRAVVRPVPAPREAARPSG
jgi:alpha-1,2-mannosyltransferase